MTTDDKAELLKIGELARRAGVGRGTIQHYLREGLLPPPVKTQRNMAYYDAACVDRIKTIKELQTRRHLPLSVIREILGDPAGEGEIAVSLLDAQKAALDSLAPPTSARPLTREAAARAFGLGPKVIDTLEEIGLIAAREEDGQEVLAGHDLEVLAAVSNLAKLGFRAELGFKAADLRLYREALEELLGKEVSAFFRAVTKHRKGEPLEHVPELARSAVSAGTLLVVALRRKLAADLLGSTESEFLRKILGSGGEGENEK